jgi:hypothetical protein
MSSDDAPITHRAEVLQLKAELSRVRQERNAAQVRITELEADLAVERELNGIAYCRLLEWHRWSGGLGLRLGWSSPDDPPNDAGFRARAELVLLTAATIPTKREGSSFPPPEE